MSIFTKQHYQAVAEIMQDFNIPADYQAAFQAEVKALTGILLGGIKVHQSAPFIKQENAKAWLAQCLQANKQANRNPIGTIKVRIVARRDCADSADSLPDYET